MSRPEPHALYATFASALLQPNSRAPAGLTTGEGVDPAPRFDVHRNNVMAGLIEALAKRFPACRRVVGEAFFHVMAGLFVQQAPPRSPILSEYGEGFAAFVEAFPPAAGLPYLADVARLEFAIGCAYHAADATPIPIEAVNAVPRQRWRHLRFGLHPSVRLVPSAYPIVSIRRTNAFDREVCEIDGGIAENALVTRPHLQVDVRAVPPGTLAFLQTLAAGKLLADAAAKGTEADSGFDLAASLAEIFAAGVVVKIL